MHDESSRADFFISYTASDRDWAEWVFNTLSAAGYRCRFQDDPVDGTSSGLNFVDWMQRALLDSERVLCVVSNAYVSAPSGFASSEWQAAYRSDPTGHKGRLVPVFVEHVDNLGLLGPVAGIHLAGTVPGAPGLADRLVEGVQHLANRALPPHRTPGAAATPTEAIEIWVRDRRPTGLRSFVDRPETAGFRAFLGEGRMPYFSRGDFAATDRSHSNLRSEDALLDGLLGDDSCGLVISGRGGLGKTRLSLELARRSRARGWPVIRATTAFTFEALSELPHHLHDQKRLLILFDYLEQVSSFDSFVDEVESINADFDCRIRFVGSCRPTHRRTIDPFLSTADSLDLSPVDDSARARLESSFRTDVTRRILEHAELAADPILAQTCRDIPVLAVFMSWLQATGRDTDLKQLTEERDFARWVVRRIRSSFPNARQAEDALAILAAALPIPKSATVELEAEGAIDLLDGLIHDGWVDVQSLDEEGDAFCAVHDVLADQLIAQGLDGRSAGAVNLVRRSIALARRCRRPASALQALARVRERLFDVDVGALVLDDFRAAPEAWRSHVPLLLDPANLATEHAVTFLGEVPADWVDVANDRSFHTTLARLCRAANHEDPDQLDRFRSTLDPWLERCFAARSGTNAALVGALRMDPERHQQAAREAIGEYGTAFQTQFLINAWLQKGLGTEAIASEVLGWLAHWGLTFEASFVLVSWLNAGGDRSSVEGRIRQWLDRHCPVDANHRARVATDSSFVLYAWILAGGEHATIQPHLCAWLDAQAGADGAFPALGQTGHLIAAWLHSGPFAVVEPWLPRWFARADAAERSSAIVDRVAYAKVLTAWVASKPPPESVHARVAAWLAHNAPTTADAPNEVVIATQYLFNQWMLAGFDPVTVAPYVHAWLDLFCQPPGPDRSGPRDDAIRVLNSWLESGGPTEDVEAAVRIFMTHNRTHPEIDFLIRDWVEAKGDFAVVREVAIAWLHEHREDAQAVYVTKHLAAEDTLGTESVLDLLHWCSTFANNEDAAWRLSRMNTHLVDATVAQPALATAEAVIGQVIEHDRSDLGAAHVGMIGVLCSLFQNPGLQAGGLRGRLDRLLVRWLRWPRAHESDAIVPAAIQDSTYTGAVLNLMKIGRLDPQSDRVAIGRLNNWVRRTWNEERQAYCAHALLQLRSAGPPADDAAAVR